MWGNPYDDEDYELDEPYEGWVDTSGNPVNLGPGEAFVTKASGTKAQHSDGVVRDTEEGKPRFDLMFPKGVPFEQQLMTRVAELYYRGGKTYGMRNWENSETEETLAHHEAALWRHMMKFYLGVKDGEDHAAAIVWNVNAVDLTRRKIAEKREADKTLGRETAGHSMDLDRLQDEAERLGFKLVSKVDVAMADYNQACDVWEKKVGQAGIQAIRKPNPAKYGNSLTYHNNHGCEGHTDFKPGACPDMVSEDQDPMDFTKGEYGTPGPSWHGGGRD